MGRESAERDASEGGRMRLAPEQLSERRKRILDGIVEGKSNPVLAEELGLTLDGIKWHVSEMLGELNLSSRQELAAWWREEHRKSAPVATPLGRVRAALRWGTRVALTAVITGAAVFGIWCAAARNNTAEPPAVSAGAPALAYITVDGAAEGDDPAHAVSHLYIEEPGKAPRLVRDYPGQTLYEMLASPDGRYIALTTGEMVILARDGSQVMDLGAAAVSFSGAGPFASWSADSRYFAFTKLNVAYDKTPGAADALATPPVALDPSKPETWVEIIDVDARKAITPNAISHTALSLPSWAPDGRRFVAVVSSDPAGDASDVVSVDASSGETRVLNKSSALPLWSPDGSSIALWFGDDVAINDNGTRRVLRGALGIIPSGGGEPDHFYDAWFLSSQAWAPDGSRLAAACFDSGQATARPPTTRLCLIPRDGERDAEMIPGVDNLSDPAFSPDGKSIAYLAAGNGDGVSVLRVVDLSTRVARTVASGVPVGGFSWLTAAARQ